MSNPTTPFSWQMPENTDLVTDLPADFEVFGQAVATSMQDLLGGTTGQVLAKASNTDMDFVWSADAAGMTNPMTTTADIIYSSPNSTPVRLGIGTANQVLRVNSGATAPEWATPAAGGGMTLLSTTNLSGSSSVTVSGISTAYQNLFVIWGGATFSGSAEVGIDIIANGNVEGIVTTQLSGSVTNSGNQNSFVRTNQQISGTGGNNAGGLTIYDYASTTRYKLWNYVAGDPSQASMSAGIVENNAAVTSITVFTLTSPNFTAGTIRIFGVS